MSARAAGRRSARLRLGVRIDLGGINLQLPRGEFFGLFGPNGALLGVAARGQLPLVRAAGPERGLLARTTY